MVWLILFLIVGVFISLVCWAGLRLGAIRDEEYELAALKRRRAEAETKTQPVKTWG